jgi:hypothetical protein
MKIGMVIYSQTGNTLSVAQKLEEKLAAAGHDVTLEHLKTVGGTTPGATNVQFESVPSIEGYDALVFGSPVNAFSLAPGMNAYMKGLPSLGGKQVALLVTQGFPVKWLGGNRAVRQMTRHCEGVGAMVRESGVVNWGNKRREDMIVEVTDRLAAAF